MESFLYQQPQFSLLDALYLLDSPIHQNGELSNASPCYTIAYNSSQEASTLSSLDDVIPLTEPQVISSGKKRKQSENNGSCLTTGQLKGAKESKSRRKQPNGPLKGTTEEEKPKTKETKVTNNEEPPSGYIHVRARRGQATDSHSLAERVRRERISERMKKLQGIVPGCDKVIGKALILDKIINYVQSLQNQVEEMGSLSQPISSTIFQNSHIPLTTFEGAAKNLQVIDPHSSSFPVHGHLGSTAFSQDNSSILMQVGDNRRGLPNQVKLKNMLCYQ